MSERCQKCLRPAGFCLCGITREIDSGMKFVFLMHPKEARRQRTGTGRIARNALKDAEIIVGIDFAQNTRLSGLLAEPNLFPVLLYPKAPGTEVWTAESPGFRDALCGRTLMPIVIDATWFCSRKIIGRSPNLLSLPRFSFRGSYRSIFTFKREPRPECISTIETCYYLIKELQAEGIANQDADPEPLMDAFKKMIQDQLRAENERIAGLRPDSHANDWKYTVPREIPKF